MKIKYQPLTIILVIIGTFFSLNSSSAQTLANRLKDQILLQVQENGEAWYVNPLNEQRYFMGRPSQAFELMRNLGIGITNQNLEKIPVADANL